MAKITQGLKIAGVIAALFLINGCGTTSVLKLKEGIDPKSIIKFDNVIVSRFNNKVAEKDVDDKKIDWACDKFADTIVGKIEATKSFEKVSREGEPTDTTLLIDGDVTKYIEGNAFARFMIGFGAGSSYFEADVAFKDGGTKDEFGTIKVDKTSWALGGGIASGQTPEDHMNVAADKIASEAKKLAKPK